MITTIGNVSFATVTTKGSYSGRAVLDGTAETIYITRDTRCQVTLHLSSGTIKFNLNSEVQVDLNNRIIVVVGQKPNDKTLFRPATLWGLATEELIAAVSAYQAQAVEKNEKGEEKIPLSPLGRAREKIVRENVQPRLPRNRNIGASDNWDKDKDFASFDRNQTSHPKDKPRRVNRLGLRPVSDQIWEKVRQERQQKSAGTSS